MKKRTRFMLRTAAVVLICFMISYIPALATQSQLEGVRDEIEQIEEQQEENRQELDSLEEDKAYLDGRLKELNSDLSNLAEELTSLQNQLAEKEAQILENTQKLEEARAQESQQYEDMKMRIRFLYERGEHNLLEMILESRSFSDFLNISEYVESIHTYDRRMLEQYQTVKAEIAEREAQLEVEQQELAELVLKQENAMEEVEELLAEVQTSIRNTDSQIADAQQELADNEEKLRKQKAYEEELEAKKAEEDAKRLEEIKKQEEEVLPPPIISDSEEEVAMLGALIECEAGGESYEGKLAVGSVVMNRIRSSYFPNTLVEVIYQKGQFTPVTSGRFATVLSRGANASCIQAAREVLGGNITLNSLYFRRNTGTIQGIVIGNHVFY